MTLLDKWKLMEAILADSNLTFSAKAVAFTLLDHLNNRTGRCDPGYDQIARRIGSGSDSSSKGRRATAVRAVYELIEAKWINAIQGGGKRSTNSYTLNFQRVGICVSFNAQREAFQPTLANFEVAPRPLGSGSESDRHGKARGVRFSAFNVRKSSVKGAISVPEPRRNYKNLAEAGVSREDRRVRVMRTSAAGEAWERYWRSFGKRVPWHQMRGATGECWDFPSEFPPEAETDHAARSADTIAEPRCEVREK